MIQLIKRTQVLLFTRLLLLDICFVIKTSSWSRNGVFLAQTYWENKNYF